MHLKKAEKSRMQAEDPMERNKESDTYASFHEGDASDATNEAQVNQ